MNAKNYINAKLFQSDCITLYHFLKKETELSIFCVSTLYIYDILW